MATSRFSLEAILSLVDNMTSPYKRTVNKVNALSTRMKGGFKKVASAALKVGKVLAIGLVAAATAAAAGFALVIREAQKIEDATASFTPLLGSVEKAEELVAKLNETAATTPFQFEDIASTANALLPAMNGDIEKTVSTFRMLGDAAGGNAQRLQSISAVFSRAVLKNKVEIGDLNILTSAGVPIYTELAKSMNMTVEEMTQMVSTGKVTGAQLEDVFKTMTTEGGVFYQGMEIASQTLTGKISTLKDNIALTAATIGQQFLGQAKGFIDIAIEATGTVRNFIDANKDLIASGITKFIDSLKQIFENLKPALLGIFNLVKNLGNGALPVIIKATEFLGNVLMFLLPIVTAIVDLFQGLFQALKDSGQLDKLRETFAKTAEQLKPMRDMLIDIIATVKKWLVESNGLNVVVGLFRLLAAGVGITAGAFKLMWNIAKPILNAMMFLLRPILYVISKIIEGYASMGSGIGGVLNNMGDRSTARQENRQTRRQERRDSRSVEQQQTIVSQERAQETNQQRNDIYLHSSIPGTAISQMGSAPSTAVNLGGGQ